MLSVAIKPPEVTPEKIYDEPRGETYFTDRKRTMIQYFMRKCVPRASRPTFELALRSRLGPGKPGNGAVEVSMAQAAQDVGVTAARIHELGFSAEARHAGTPALRPDTQGVY
jgi:hypothetical protein